jgi:hypothetical protein
MRKRALGLLALTVACGSLLRTVPNGPHPSNGADPLIVDYPPPPAQMEHVKSDPGEPCRWQDGHWSWLGRRWSWEPGRWVLPPEGCHYAPPVMVWVPSEQKGELYYIAPRWYPTNAEELPRTTVLKSCQNVRPCGRPNDLAPQADGGL